MSFYFTHANRKTTWICNYRGSCQCPSSRHAMQKYMYVHVKCIKYLIYTDLRTSEPAQQQNNFPRHLRESQLGGLGGWNKNIEWRHKPWRHNRGFPCTRLLGNGPLVVTLPGSKIQFTRKLALYSQTYNKQINFWIRMSFYFTHANRKTTWICNYRGSCQCPSSRHAMQKYMYVHVKCIKYLIYTDLRTSEPATIWLSICNYWLYQRNRTSCAYDTYIWQ